MKLVVVVPLVALFVVLCVGALRPLLRGLRVRVRPAVRGGALFATRYEASSRHKARLLGNLVR
ncbi:MAG: hypothetical protein AB7P21_03825 [Lautropia sp.]